MHTVTCSYYASLPPVLVATRCCWQEGGCRAARHLDERNFSSSIHTRETCSKRNATVFVSDGRSDGCGCGHCCSTGGSRGRRGSGSCRSSRTTTRSCRSHCRSCSCFDRTRGRRTRLCKSKRESCDGVVSAREDFDGLLLLLLQRRGNA